MSKETFELWRPTEGHVMKPLQIQVVRSGYVVGKKELRTVVALEAELIRLGIADDQNRRSED